MVLSANKSNLSRAFYRCYHNLNEFMFDKKNLKFHKGSDSI